MTGAILFVLFCAVIPYLLGSLSFSIIVSRVGYHQDIRAFGSGNAGMTNVLRTFGKKAAACTLAGDVGKGILAVALARAYTGSAGGSLAGVYLAALAAVLGHVYPVYFGFKGGKAVSVATGTIIAIRPALIVPLLALFFIVFLWRRMVSLASVCCAVAYPLLTLAYYLCFEPANALVATLGAAAVGALVVWLHRGNIERIKNGTEYQFLPKK